MDRDGLLVAAASCHLAGFVERWRWVPGYAGEYAVSDAGRVLSFCKSTAGHVLKPGLATNGYYTVAIKQRNSRTVHSLVAEAFLGPRPPGCDVLHIDGSRTDNRRSNLRYGTRSENNRDIVRHGRRIVSIAALRVARQAFSAGAKVSDVARALGISDSQAHNIKSGKHYGHLVD